MGRPKPSDTDNPSANPLASQFVFERREKIANDQFRRGKRSLRLRRGRAADKTQLPSTRSGPTWSSPPVVGIPPMRQLTEQLERFHHGGKAVGLSMLTGMGLAVPPGFALSGQEHLSERTIWAAVQSLGANVGDSGVASLAVRSSAPDEDSEDASHAGEYLSILGDFNPAGLVDAITRVRSSGNSTSIPAVVQLAIAAEFSGVAFSCEPLALRRGRSTISWIGGLGERLVSGASSGKTDVVDTHDPVWPDWPSSQTNLRSLTSQLARIEAAFDAPADVEWAIDANGQLWMLQARPVVLPRTAVADANAPRNASTMHGAVAAHSKIRLRQTAATRGIAMPDAHVVTVSGPEPPTNLPDIALSADAAAMSIVLLYPDLIDGSVQREFSKVNDVDVPMFTAECRRYAIRRYPTPEASSAILHDVLTRGLRDYWTATAVVQEIYDAEATGIVRRHNGGLLIEVARGHFVPKGVVETSRLTTTLDGEILEFRSTAQETVYHFINGHVVTEHPPERQMDLTEAEIVDGVMQIASLLEDYPDASLEFGIVNAMGALRGYVIDIAEAEPPSASSKLTSELIGSGVVAPGKARAVVQRLRNSDRETLDLHHLSAFDANQTGGVRSTVVVADRASIDLLPLVNRLDSTSAFVFRSSSLLAHLPVVLRERGIPAVLIEDDALFSSLADGQLVEVDAVDPALSPSQRIRMIVE